MKQLGFGMMRLPLQPGGENKDVDIAQVCAMADEFLKQGFTYFDTAYFYHGGNSENVVRQVLTERYPRDAFVLADKLPVVSLRESADQVRIFKEQLDKCGVEYFDYYLLHSMNAAYYDKVCRLDSFGFLREKKEQGLIRHLGFSFHDSADVLDRILTDHPEVDFVQLQINYLDWEDASVQSRLCYETAARHGKPVMVMEPVKGGTLASLPAEVQAELDKVHPDWSAPAWALRFAAGLEHVHMVLSGMTTPQHLAENMATLAQPCALNERERKALETAAAMLRQSSAIPCTSCRYCVDGCPVHIPIPRYFELYNADVRTHGATLATHQAYYDAYGKGLGKASDCIGCGACARGCPQHIPIPERLKDVAKRFETD